MATIARLARPALAGFRRAVSVPPLRFRGGNVMTPIRSAIGGARTFSVATAWQDKRYTDDHEWVELSDDGKTGTIGITEYAANSLGDIIFIELPSVDAEVKQGDMLGAVESVKSAADVLSPVSGKVIKVNESMEKHPSTINRDPENDGWIATIAVTDKTEIEKLKTPEQYAAFCDEQAE